MGYHGYEDAQHLKDHLINIYSPFYQLNDRAHQIAHVISVTDTALEINEQMGFGLDEKILVGAAMTHDLFNMNRDMHHDLVRVYLLTNEIPWLDNHFSASERELMAAAAGEHRASYKGEYTSLYSEVVAAADRGAPNIKSAIIRCAIYGVDRCNYSGPDLYTHVRSHMKEKFGVLGYARYPDLYERYYAESLTRFKAVMEHLDVGIIDDYVSEHPVGKYFLS